MKTNLLFALLLFCASCGASGSSHHKREKPPSPENTDNPKGQAVVIVVNSDFRPVQELQYRAHSDPNLPGLPGPWLDVYGRSNPNGFFFHVDGYLGGTLGRAAFPAPIAAGFYDIDIYYGSVIFGGYHVYRPNVRIAPNHDGYFIYDYREWHT